MTRYLFVILFLGLVVPTRADELPLPVSEIEREEPVDFATEIMPLLKRNCLACHHEKEAEGGLVLESIEQILAGGDSGEGVVAKDPEASLIFVRSTGAEEPLMPPEDNSVGAKPFTPEELGLLKLWIQQGAHGTNAASMETIQWQPIPESIRSVLAMDVSADGRLVVVGRGNRVVLFDLQTNQEIGRLVDPSLQMGAVADYDLIQSVAAAPNGKRIATGGYRALRIWKQQVRAAEPGSTPLQSAAQRLAVHPAGQFIAMVNAIGDIEVWNASTSEKLQTLTGHGESVTGLDWSTDETLLFSADQSGLIIAWNVSSGQALATIESGTAIQDVTVASDNQHLATIDIAGNVRTFRLAEDRKSIQPVEGIATDPSSAIAFAGTESPVLAVASSTGSVKRISLESKKPISEIQHGAAVSVVAATSDGSKLITGGEDGITKVWNVADGKLLTTFQGEPATSLLAARIGRDAARQKAAVDRLNQRTEALKKELAQEDEVLKKTGEEHEKAKTNLAAEEKKQSDAIALVTKTETRLAKAKSDVEQSKLAMEQASKLLTESTAKSEAITKQVEASQTQLTSIEKQVANLQSQIDALMKQKATAAAKAQQARKVVAQQQAEKEAAIKAAADAKSKIDAAKKLFETATADIGKATKELEQQQKAVTAAKAAKEKSEAELAKRKQAFDTATSAQARAAAAIPEHQNVIAKEALRQQWLDRQLSSTQAMLSENGNAVLSIDVDGDSVAIAYANGSVRTYHLGLGQSTLNFVTTDAVRPSQVAFTGDTLVVLSANAAAKVVDRIPEWVLERTIGNAGPDSIISDRVTALDFHPNGKTIAVGSGPPSRFGDVKVFAVATGDLVRDLGEVHSDTVFGIAFSPDGRQLASAAADKTIRVIDVSTGQLVRSLEGHTHHVLSLAWQDDGQTIASASADQSIKVWNVGTGEQRRTISGFSKEITAVEFVQTSNQIVAACANGTLRLSDTANGKALRNFSSSGDFLFTVRVTPDGKKLIAAGQSGAVRIWNLADGKLIQEWK